MKLSQLLEASHHGHPIINHINKVQAKIEQGTYTDDDHWDDRQMFPSSQLPKIIPALTKMFGNPEILHRREPPDDWDGSSKLTPDHTEGHDMEWIFPYGDGIQVYVGYVGDDDEMENVGTDDEFIPYPTDTVELSIYPYNNSQHSEFGQYDVRTHDFP